MKKGEFAAALLLLPALGQVRNLRFAQWVGHQSLRAIEKILDAQITVLTFSIDGGTKEIYEEIRVGARLDTVLAKIELFKKLRERRGASLPRLQINMPRSR